MVLFAAVNGCQLSIACREQYEDLPSDGTAAWRLSDRTMRLTLFVALRVSEDEFLTAIKTRQHMGK